MSRGNVLSAAWLVLALAGVAWTGARSADAPLASAPRSEKSSRAASATYRRLPNGEQGVVDANGFVVPVRPYKRIATVSTVADTLVLSLVEPERIYALSNYGRKHSETAYLYGQRLVIADLHQLEQLVEEGVDLVILNHIRSQSELARMRESGIQVFNLGDMLGMQSLLPNIAAVTALLGHAERGRAYAENLVRRMKMVAADIVPERRKRAIYVAAYANQLFGGSVGTSYHDVLVSAGLIDVAAGRYKGWPAYDPEQLLELDPELVIVNEGTDEALCLVGGLQNLRACQNQRAGVVSLPDSLLSDPGPRMLDAAEALRDKVYGAPL